MGRPPGALSACASAQLANTLRTRPSVVGRAPAARRSTPAAPPRRLVEGNLENDSTGKRQQRTGLAPTIRPKAAIKAAAARCCALPTRRPSRPHAFAEVTQEAGRRVEQFGQQGAVARRTRLVERPRRVTSHCETEPACQGNCRRNASPTGKELDGTAAAPSSEWNDPTRRRRPDWRYRTGSRDDALQACRRRLGEIERSGRPNIRRSFRICGKQGSYSLLLLLGIEQPVGISRKVEESRGLVLGHVDPAAALP